MQYVASISYGKDSLAMLHVIKDVLHKPLDHIVTADVWATDDIPADLPPMVEFKTKADAIIRERWGIEVTHFYAKNKNGEKITYEKEFYHVYNKSIYQERIGNIRGFPCLLGPWCNTLLKMDAIKLANKSYGENDISYIGIAADEPKRIERHKIKKNIEMPLVEAGWSEAMCRQWCEENELLSPLYKTSNRGGCWFCPNQSIDELRLLRTNNPKLWDILLRWDDDSPWYAQFKPDRTVHDYERRFRLEDEGFTAMGEPFRWSNLKEAQMNVFQFVPDPDRKDSA